MSEEKAQCGNCIYGARLNRGSAGRMYCTKEEDFTWRELSCLKYKGPDEPEEINDRIAAKTADALHDLADNLRSFLPEAVVLDGSRLLITFESGNYTPIVRTEFDLFKKPDDK